MQWDWTGRQTMGAKRRSSKKRALVRGEPVVRGVLEATVEELARAGYGALRIEDVAARAGVNKTTVYRRWPTKQELVLAALQSVSVDQVVTPDTGSLRGDLLAVGRHMAEVMTSAGVQGLRRMTIAEEQNPEFRPIMEALRDSFEALPRPVIEAANKRGEIASGVDARMLFSTLAGAVEHRLFMQRREVDDAFLRRIVDLLLLGALSPDKR